MLSCLPLYRIGIALIFAFGGFMGKFNYLKSLVAGAVSVSLVAAQVHAQDVPPAATAPQVTAPAAAPSAEKAAAAAWEQEYALWQAAATGNTVDEYQSYLSAYPTGTF